MRGRGAAGHPGGGGRRRPRWCSRCCPPPTWRDASTSPRAAGPGAAVPIPGGLAGDGGEATQPAQAGHPGRGHPGGRLPGLRQPPRHRPAGARWATRRDAGAGPAAVVLGRRDLRRPGTGPELERSRPTAPPRTASTSGSPFILPAADSRGLRGAPDRPADLLHRAAVAQPGLPRRQRRTRCGSRATTSTCRATTPSCRPSASVPAPSTPCESDVATPTAAQLRAGRRRRPPPGIERRCRHDPSSPTPTPGSRPWPRPSPPQRRHLRQGRGLIAWIGAHTHYSTDIPPLAPGPGHRRRVPLRQPHRLLRADLHVAGRACCAPSASRPARRSGTCPGPTTPSPTSTTCRPRTPTPGSRCGSPATAGRASTPPPSSPWPTRRRAPRWSTTPPARCAACRGCPSAWSSAGLGRSRGGARRRRRPATWAETAARRIERPGPARGGAGVPRRPSPSTPPPSTPWPATARERGSALAAVVEASAYGRPSSRRPASDERIEASARAPVPRRARPAPARWPGWRALRRGGAPSASSKLAPASRSGR